MQGTQVVIKEVSDPLIFNQLLYPEYTPETRNWINQSINASTSHLMQQGAMFIQQVQKSYAEMYDASRMRLLKEALERMEKPEDDVGYIHSFFDPVAFREAAQNMQRFIMAQPDIRSDYQKQRLFGYEGSYVDTDPDKIGEAHYDYRRAVNGLEAFVDGRYVTKIYDEELRPNDRELTFAEQIRLHVTWEAGNLMRTLGIDPTRSY